MSIELIKATQTRIETKANQIETQMGQLNKALSLEKKLDELAEALATIDLSSTINRVENLLNIVSQPNQIVIEPEVIEPEVVKPEPKPLSLDDLEPEPEPEVEIEPEPELEVEEEPQSTEGLEFLEGFFTQLFHFNTKRLTHLEDYNPHSNEIIYQNYFFEILQPHFYGVNALKSHNMYIARTAINSTTVKAFYKRGRQLVSLLCSLGLSLEDAQPYLLEFAKDALLAFYAEKNYVKNNVVPNLGLPQKTTRDVISLDELDPLDVITTFKIGDFSVSSSTVPKVQVLQPDRMGKSAKQRFFTGISKLELDNKFVILANDVKQLPLSANDFKELLRNHVGVSVNKS